MWLSMLTADAAAQHGHEFSAPRPQNQSQTQNAGLRLPFPRTPFSVLPNGFARTTTAGPSAAGPTRTLLPKRSRSLRVTMAELKEVPEEIEEWDEDQIKHLKIPGAFKESHSQLGLEAHFKAGEHKGKGKALAVQENVRSISALDTRSLAASPTPKSPLIRRLPRAKQQFRLAHPPPPAKAKKHLRPRVLLQLQQQATSGFHKPSFEVLPACRFYNDTKVGTKLTKLRNKAQRNGQLNSEDLVVVQIDESKATGATGEDADPLEGRIEIGIICAAGSEDGKTAGNAFIYLENSIWKATLNKSGIYDLVLQGDEEQKCRWFIPKSKRQRPVSFTGAENLAAASDDKKFYFTTISPDTTKHPTVAAMTKQSLDVYDSYARAIPNDHSSTPMERTTSSSFSGAAADQGEEYFTREEQTPVDDTLRRLIIVSSAWLFVREGWSPFFHYSLNTSINLPSTPQSAASLRSLPRSLSTPIDTIKTLEAKTTDRRDSKVSSLVNIPRLVRSATSRSRAQSYRGRSPSGTSSPIPFAGFEPKSTSTSRPVSLRQDTSTATPSTLSAPSSAPPSERSPSPSPHSIARQRQVANLEEVLHSSQPVSDKTKTPELRSSTPTPPRRTQTPVPDSPAESLEESNTPAQYWQQYDAFMSRNMHKRMFEPTLSSSKNDRARMDTSPAEDHAHEALPMREITARPTDWTTTKNEPTWADRQADHEFMTRRQRFHNWRHDMWSQMKSVKQADPEVPLDTNIVARELTAPTQILPELPNGAVDLPTSPPSRMQSFKADMSARMMRRRTRGRANTIDANAIDAPKVMHEQQIINVTTDLDQDVSPLDGAPIAALEPEIVHLTEVESIDRGCGPTGCRSSWHRRLNSVKTPWSRNRGDSIGMGEFGEAASQGPRFDPGFHPRWLRAHR